jgi:mRNA interferase MazF
VEIAGRSTLVLAEQTAAVDPARLGGSAGHLRSSAASKRPLRLVMEL